MPETSRRVEGWASGFVAMLGTILVMFAVRFALGVPTLPELLADPVLYAIPAPIFAALIDTLRFAGKPTFLLTLLLGQLSVGALVGHLWSGHLLHPPGLDLAATLRSSLLLCALIWVASGTILMPLLGVGFFGSLGVAGIQATAIGYLACCATYGVVLASTYTWQTRRLKSAPVLVSSRRNALWRIGLGALAVVGAGVAWRSLDAVIAIGGPKKPAALPSPITPIGSFYVVAKDLVGVNVDLAAWKLTVVGNGTGTRQFDLRDLQALPATEITSTLTCISNEIGGNLIGTARWTGVRLRDVLALVGVGPRAYAVALTGWDNYQDSIPIARALNPNTLLVYAMDGEPLRGLHGFPLRLIVPGLYGIKNVKWIKQIDVLDHGFQGYWQARGWTDDATVQTQSQIDVPYAHAVFPRGPIQVGGIAFAGDRGISRVDLSTDNGRNWITADFRPPLSSLTWVTWTVTWEPTTSGWHRLIVRATDGLGQLQRSDVTPPIPDGATGYHGIDLRVG